jgi:hypothetical protein
MAGDPCTVESCITDLKVSVASFMRTDTDEAKSGAPRFASNP